MNRQLALHHTELHSSQLHGSKLLSSLITVIALLSNSGYQCCTQTD